MVGMPCSEVKTTKYQTRKSPAFHAGNCKHLTKKGRGGDYISKPDAKGVYKWVKTRKAGKAGKSYLIHNNGARPFRVEVSGKTVEIYKGVYGKLADGKTIDYDTMNYNTLLKKLTVKEVHVGNSPCIPAADACGASMKGNSLLLHITGNKYVYVGREIYEFTMEDDFEAYYSLVGNNDVPYPVTLGSNYVYLMLEKKYIPRDLFKMKMNAGEWADAHSYFYGHKDFEVGKMKSCFEQYPKTDARQKCMKERAKKHARIMKGFDKNIKGIKKIEV